MQRDVVRLVEGGATARQAIQDQTRGEGRNHRLAALVQPRSAAFDTGLRQPDAVRAGLACQSATASQLMNSAMGYGFQEQGQCRFAAHLHLHHVHDPEDPTQHLRTLKVRALQAGT